MTEILLKVALNTINQNQTHTIHSLCISIDNVWLFSLLYLKVSSPLIWSGIHVARSSFLCSIMSTIVCPFSFSHYIVCPSSIYGIWLTFDVFKPFLQEPTIMMVDT
jgi:hypothetical protein